MGPILKRYMCLPEVTFTGNKKIVPSSFMLKGAKVKERSDHNAICNNENCVQNTKRVKINLKTRFITCCVSVA
jgi:hypothetical protein